jgi:hypothetical protein
MAVHRLHNYPRLAKRFMTVGLPTDSQSFSPNHCGSGTIFAVPDSGASA